MKIAIIGSRNIEDERPIINVLNELKNITSIVSGGAKGVDTIAEKWALSKGIETDIIKPNYAMFKIKKLAPLARNEEIILKCDLVLAFWDGKSKGTAHAIRIAQKLNKPINIYTING
jgi:hypothetical protein